MIYFVNSETMEILGGVSIEGLSRNELKATAALLAYDHNIDIKDIKIKVRRKEVVK